MALRRRRWASILLLGREFHEIRLERVRPYLTSPFDLFLRAFHGGQPRLFLFPSLLIQPGFQHFHRAFAVLELRALLLAGNDDPAGDVRNADSRFHLVDVLSPLPSGSIRIDLEVRGIDLYDDVLFYFRINKDRCERSVTARVRIER